MSDLIIRLKAVFESVKKRVFLKITSKREGLKKSNSYLLINYLCSLDVGLFSLFRFWSQ